MIEKIDSDFEHDFDAFKYSIVLFLGTIIKGFSYHENKTSLD